MNKENTSIQNRMFILRSNLNLTVRSFAEKLNISAGLITNMEKGRRIITDRTIADICTKFNVNEEWLRNGTGDMYLKKDRMDNLASLTKQLLKEEEDSFKNRLISALAVLTEEQWEVLADIAEKITKKD